MKIEFTMPGDAVPQPRERIRATMNAAGKAVGYPYLPKSHPVNSYKAALRIAAADVQPTIPWSEPVMAAIDFVFSRPKSHFRAGKFAGLLKSAAPRWATARQVGDIDNLLKSTFDALNDVLWFDDAQVIGLHKIVSRYHDQDEEPHVKVSVWTVDPF